MLKTIIILLLLFSPLQLDTVHAVEFSEEEEVLKTEGETEEKKPETKPITEDSTTEEKPSMSYKEQKLKEALEKEKVEKEYYVKYKSILYKDDNLAKMINVLSAIKRDTAYKETGETQEFDTREISSVFDSAIASVYLNSIMYVSDNLWSVWVNGIKISNINNGENELRVLDINNSRVKFLWIISMTKWEIISQNAQIPEDAYKIKESAVEIQFTLEPNQSYILSFNKVVEGNVKKEIVTATEEESEKEESEEEKPQEKKKKGILDIFS